MNAILLDTNAYSAFKAGRDDAVAVVRDARRVGISAVVLGELLGGFELGSSAKRNRRELGRFLGSPRVALLGVTRATAVHYGRIRSALKRKGRPIPANDIWIAASAVEYGLALFSYDAHFKHVPDLKRLKL